MNELKQRILDKLAKERTKSGWDWLTFREKNLEANPKIEFSLQLTERAVELTLEEVRKQAGEKKK